MRVGIGKIAVVHMGYPFRARLEMVEDGNFKVIQMKDIDENSHLDVRGLVPVSLPEVNNMHRVEKGDVLFRSRGRVNTATLVDAELVGVVVAAPLLCIRVKKDKVMPEYLAWYINQPGPQGYLSSQATGTISRMINIKAVEAMEIEIPPLEQQKRMVAIAQLANREQELLQQLAKKRKIYVDGMLKRFVAQE